MVEATMAEAPAVLNKEEEKPAEAKQPVTQMSSVQETHLCMVGVEKHWIEKDLIKFFRKTFNAKPGAEESKNEAGPIDEIPLKGVAKKRGKTFAFLQFTDLAEKTDFMEQFTITIAPKGR